MILVKLLENEKSVREICEVLGVSKRTVQIFMRKWGLKTTGRRGPDVHSENQRSIRRREQRWEKVVKGYLEKINFWELPYIVVDVTGQPHVSNSLVLRRITFFLPQVGQFLLEADRLTGEKVSAYVHKCHLEVQRKSLMKG